MVRCYQVIKGDVEANVMGWPHIVLEDTKDRVALYMPQGTPLWRWDVVEGKFQPPAITQGESVRLFFPGRNFEVTLFYETGSGPSSVVQFLFPGAVARGRFYGWKVDMT